MTSLREAYEKRKEARATKKESTWGLKDTLTTSLSALAFILSAINAYYSFWRKQDDLSFVVQTPPFAVRANKQRLEVDAKEFDVAFLNSGNQPAVILSAWISYVQHRLGDEEKCTLDNSTHLQTNLTPVVVKPNEVATVSMRVANGPWYDNNDIRHEKTGMFSFPVAADNLDKGRFPIDVCLMMNVSTPAHSEFIESPPVYKYWVEGESGGWSWSSDEGPTSLGRPLELLKKGTFAFPLWE